MMTQVKTNKVKWFTIAVTYLKSNKSTREPDYNTSLIPYRNRMRTMAKHCNMSDLPCVGNNWRRTAHLENTSTRGPGKTCWVWTPNATGIRWTTHFFFFLDFLDGGTTVWVEGIPCSLPMWSHMSLQPCSIWKHRSMVQSKDRCKCTRKWLLTAGWFCTT